MGETKQKPSLVIYSKETGMLSEEKPALQWLLREWEAMGFLSSSFLNSDTFFHALQKASRESIGVVLEAPESQVLSLLARADCIRKAFPGLVIMMLLTAEEEEADFSPIGFRILRIPERDMHVQEAIRRNTEQYRKAEYRLSYWENGDTVFLDAADVVWFSVDKTDGAEAETVSKGKVRVGGSLLDWWRVTERLGFVRIHRSYLINIRYLEKMETDTVVVSIPSGKGLPPVRKTVPFGRRRYGKELKEALRLYKPDALDPDGWGASGE